MKKFKLCKKCGCSYTPSIDGNKDYCDPCISYLEDLKTFTFSDKALAKIVALLSEEPLKLH